MRIALMEMPFEDGPARHSRFLSGTVQVNELNSDYRREMSGSEEAQLTYSTLMIGKETIAYQDKSGATDDYLEKILSFMFQVREKTGRGSTKKRQRARTSERSSS